MMLTRAITLMLVVLFSGVKAQEKVKLYGRVTDFKGNPIDSVSVRLKNKQFENLYETLSDKSGNFSLQVERDTYYCLYAIKLSDYKKTKLEYWAWNVPIYEDLEVNPQYDRMEIYGINVFEPQVSPFETYMIYFRPMSLTKSLKLSKINKGDTLNAAPEKITDNELTVKINGINTKVVTINRVTEYGRGNYFYGYTIQVLKPENNHEKMNDSEKVKGYDKITIILTSNETDEMGKGEYYFKRVEKE